MRNGALNSERRGHGFARRFRRGRAQRGAPDASRLTLAMLHPGEEAEVEDVAEVPGGQAEAGIISRLREIGMVPGARLRVARAGCPMIVELGHTRYCLRRREAALVFVRVAEAMASACTDSPSLIPASCHHEET